MDGVPATNNPLLEIRTPVSSGEFCKTTAPVPVEDALMAIVPDVVIGDPVTVINEGTVTATEVTVPLVKLDADIVPANVKFPV